MRISIWQQFSSNHSGGFTVVGTFKSSAEANAAASEIRRLLQGLADWYSDPANLKALEEGLEWNEVPFAPIERQFMAKYKISEANWTWREDGIDWIREPEDVDKALSIAENRVFVTNPDNTWQGAEPMNILLEQLGTEQVVSDSDAYSWIGINLTFTTPDEVQSKSIVRTLNTYFKTHNSETIGGLASALGSLWKGHARREGARVFIEQAQLTGEYLSTYLPEIVSQLERHGFRDVSCELKEIPYEQPKHQSSASPYYLPAKRSFLEWVLRLTLGCLLIVVHVIIETGKWVRRKRAIQVMLAILVILLLIAFITREYW